MGLAILDGLRYERADSGHDADQQEGDGDGDEGVNAAGRLAPQRRPEERPPFHRTNPL
jgi:hypothetical protein